MIGDEGKHEDIYIIEVDDRADYNKGEFYPRLIYLSTVLRWAIKGNYSREELDTFAHPGKVPPPELLDELQRLNEEQRLAHPNFSPEQLDEIEKLSAPTYTKCAQIRCNNNSALTSVGSLLADGIESGAIAVFNAHSRLSIGSAEQQLLVSRLRTMDATSLEIDAWDKYLDGKALYQFVMAKAAPIDDRFQKGGVWMQLAWGAPSEWRAPLALHEQSVIKTEASPQASAAGEQEPPVVQAGTPNGNTDGDDWKVKAIGIADKIALSRWESGAREITARNICDAVATELGTDFTTHGNRGPRSAGSVRSVALKGWKFTPPSGTNGTSGMNV